MLTSRFPLPHGYLIPLCGTVPREVFRGISIPTDCRVFAALTILSLRRVIGGPAQALLDCQFSLSWLS